MSRVFEAMRRQNTAGSANAAAPPEVLETFLVEPTPSVDGADEPDSTPSTAFWAEPAVSAGHPEEKLTAVDRKRDRMARSFADLLRELAIDEREHGY